MQCKEEACEDISCFRTERMLNRRSFLYMLFGYTKGGKRLNKELKNAIEVTDKEAQYDACAKWLLSQKIILAHILVKTVEEFKGMKPEEVVPYIEGEPHISTVPVNPGLTNAVKKEGEKRHGADSNDLIIGLNTENRELHEGVIYFDIIFYVRLKSGLSKIIINVEAQKDEPTKYGVLNRAVFYTSRMISSQKEREFNGSDYNGIKQVYSIWICMGMKENTMSHICLTEKKLLGSHRWKGRLDLFNVVMIGLSDNLPEHDEAYELHRLLGALLSKQMEVTEKLEIIENEYHIPMETETEELSIMCNLGLGIREAGKEEGIIMGEEKMGRLSELLIGLGRQEDIIKAVKDRSYLQKLYKEFCLY